MPETAMLNSALFAAAILGFRHGFDYDHIAAITDIASVQRSTREAMKMGLLYAIGHAATVAVLGLAVILLQVSLPEGIDAAMERVVGITLVVLGAYVLWTTVFPRHRSHPHLPRTRVMMLANGALWLHWRVRQWFSRRPVERKVLFADGLGKAPAVLVGVIHGLGAETPSQLMIFLLAANLGGAAKGLLGVGMFIVGMLVMNTLMCGAAAGLFKASHNAPAAFRWVAAVTALFSIGLGALYLAGPEAMSAVVGH